MNLSQRNLVQTASWQNWRRYESVGDVQPGWIKFAL
jgi:hypothetical protein